MPEPDNKELYSIVVLGDMNPRIHSPSWYQRIGLLDEPEAQTALKSKGLVCVAPFAQFDVEGFVITCTEDRWEVKTQRKDLRERILRIAGTVFDRLGETPVSEFGFNFNYRRATRLPDIGEHLGKAVAALALGLEAEGRTSAGVKFRSDFPNRHVSVEIQPTRSAPQVVYIGNNVQYNISEIVKEPSHFDLAPLLDERFHSDHQEAETRVSRIVDMLNQAAEVNHAATIG